jgi:hypothetical protein
MNNINLDTASTLMKSMASMQSLKLSYDLKIDSSFEKRLMVLKKSNKKTLLSTIQLNTLNQEGNDVPIILPVERVRITEAGKVYCETMLTQQQLNLSGPEEEEAGAVLLSIEVQADNQKIAASTEVTDVKVDIDFEKLQTPIVLFSVNFVTQHPKVIKKGIMDKQNPKDTFIYALYDESINSEGNSVTFYTEKNYGGDPYSYKIGDTHSFYNYNHPLNDKFKSVKLGPKCQVHVWEDGQYAGKETIFTKNSPDMNIGHSGISSFAITYNKNE